MSNTTFIDTRKTTQSLSVKPAVSSVKFKGLTVAVLGSVLMLAGCATKPTYQASGPSVQVNARGVPNYYQVKSGDTVSHIAARYGLNYRQIGALNRLDSKYTIYAGQWLKLWEGGAAAPVVTNTRNNTPVYNTPAPVTTPTTPSYNATATSTKGYGYPSSNPVVKNFNATAGDMGMWFSGRIGDPVLASKGGQVLYAGNGLPEYGNLIMIRHDDRYITVYAHNNELLVKEGDQVQAGQRIATMGNSGQTNQVGLQFQVRENGTPIDPRAVLGL
ncbi:peptidoglycan DD-metalloendopeptidase family protein [Psychrobacter raelei]|uniref:Peptidoglycan DD-metalloendopeptidase family protein n=1 Tax=Psychrobacter raelei TaxID=2565531 RepID=A0AAT9PEH8_9GAMM|nr:M23 family metallopeptidase [Psychrobacter sp. PraFG1]UNK04846.1 peptidoglycan DD-metalloendopeptidase family protein [Psychrobacter sp. PraFG1]